MSRATKSMATTWPPPFAMWLLSFCLPAVVARAAQEVSLANMLAPLPPPPSLSDLLPDSQLQEGSSEGRLLQQKGLSTQHHEQKQFLQPRGSPSVATQEQVQQQQLQQSSQALVSLSAVDQQQQHQQHHQQRQQKKQRQQYSQHRQHLRHQHQKHQEQRHLTLAHSSSRGRGRSAPQVRRLRSAPRVQRSLPRRPRLPEAAIQNGATSTPLRRLRAKPVQRQQNRHSPNRPRRSDVALVQQQERYRELLVQYETQQHEIEVAAKRLQQYGQAKEHAMEESLESREKALHELEAQLQQKVLVEHRREKETTLRTAALDAREKRDQKLEVEIAEEQQKMQKMWGLLRSRNKQSDHRPQVGEGSRKTKRRLFAALVQEDDRRRRQEKGEGNSEKINEGDSLENAAGAPTLRQNLMPGRDRSSGSAHDEETAEEEAFDDEDSAPFHQPPKTNGRGAFSDDDLR